MALQMELACATCETGLAPDDEAVICSYECTFCAACSWKMGGACPNCVGELLRRPRRAPAPDLAQIKIGLD